MLLQSLQPDNNDEQCSNPITRSLHLCNPLAADEASSGSDGDAEEHYIQQTKRLPSSKPCKPPIKNRNSNLRRSARLQGKYRTKQWHMSLRISDTKPYAGKELKHKRVY